jgi:hypothetical protein
LFISLTKSDESPQKWRDRSDKINVLSLKYKEIITTSISKIKAHPRELRFHRYKILEVFVGADSGEEVVIFSKYSFLYFRIRGWHLSNRQ